jgi:NADP-dependent 3-hydroxy acid dehydrogenase YdfG
MSSTLEGTVALITGASSGIGEATARALAGRGAKVALAARRLERLERLAAEIAGHGHTALAIQADIAERAQATEAVDRTVDELGRLDIVVNNAGVMLLGPIEGAPVEEWDRMIDLNLKGLIHTTHAALPHLLAATVDSERRCADVVNISSVAGRVARAGSGVYNLTKHGVGAFSESFRQEFASRRVRSIVVEPGAVDTELTNHVREGVRDQVRERFAGIEVLEASDVADAIAYAVTRPWHVSLNEILIRPTEQRG